MGLLATTRAFAAWLEGGPASVTTGEMVGLAVVILLAGTIFSTRTLRVIVEHRWLALLLPALLVGVLVAIFLLLSEPLFAVPTLSLGVAGVLMLVVSVALSWFDGPADADEITAPGQEPVSPTRRRLLTALVLPLTTLLVLAFVWALDTFA